MAPGVIGLRGRRLVPVALALAISGSTAAGVAAGSDGWSKRDAAVGASIRRTASEPHHARGPAGAPAGGPAGAPAGGPVPAATRATSVSFISPSTGFVLGTAPCVHAPCSVILRTRDRGASWVGLPAPRQSVGLPQNGGLWGLLFANAADGYAFGDGLWQTVDGGGRWQRLTGAAVPGRSIDDLAAVDDRELVAITAPCPAGDCLALPVLTHRSLHGGRWIPIARTRPGEGGDEIAVHGRVVWVLLGERIYVSVDGGLAFGRDPQPCDPRTGSDLAPTSISDDGAHSYLLFIGEPGTGSSEKRVYVTSGPDASWTRVGPPGTGGTGGTIAAGSDHAILVASSSGASFIYRSSDGARRWGTGLFEDDGGIGWADLGFTSSSDAVVVHGPAGVAGIGNGTGGRLLLSDDGGRTWQTSHF